MKVGFKKSFKVMLAVLVILMATTVLSFARGNVRKIVIFDESVVNEAAKAVLIERFGGENIKTLPLVNGMAVAIPEPAVAALSNSAGVLRVDDDVTVYAVKRPSSPGGGKPGGGGDTSQPPQQLTWGVNRIDAEYAWANGYTGFGVNVAVIDTGIDYTHPDLANNVKGGINIINSKKSYKDDDRQYSHGTHVSGTIAAENNAIGVVGVAPEANLFGVKVLSGSGTGYLSDVIAGIEWCVANNMDIANMSLGTSSDIQSMHDACDAASSAGLIIVAAAGNNGGPVIYPAGYSSTIAVGATDINDNRAYFSSYGPMLDIVAPGVNILSTTRDGGYGYLDGTSMATPHVTGTIALNLSADIYVTADDLPPAGADDFTGSGLVDAGEAATGIVDLGDDLP